MLRLVVRRTLINEVQLSAAAAGKFCIGGFASLKFSFEFRVLRQQFQGSVFKDVRREIFFLLQNRIKIVPGEIGVGRLGFERFQQVAVWVPLDCSKTVSTD